jgi:hypothetical protein
MAKEIPAAPNTGKAVLPLFRLGACFARVFRLEACFARAIVKSPFQSTRDGLIALNWQDGFKFRLNPTNRVRAEVNKVTTNLAALKSIMS